jgi:hypothetical protein
MTSEERVDSFFNSLAADPQINKDPEIGGYLAMAQGSWKVYFDPDRLANILERVAAAWKGATA